MASPGEQNVIGWRGNAPERGSGPWPWLYNAALLGGAPLVAGYLAYRIAFRGKSWTGLAERFGAAPALGEPPAAGRVWLHAVSAGEAAALAPVARWLWTLSPETEVVVSTTTPAGQQQARRLLPGARAHFYFPFDYLPCVASALQRVRPTLIAPVETEIWPNWFDCARRRGIPCVIVNGRFSDRGYRRARLFPWLHRWALGLPEELLMQSKQDAERAVRLGAPPERVRITGQTKFEQALEPLSEEARAALRAELGLDGRQPLLVAGSTHPGEEAQVLEAWETARAAVPELQLLLAPRHVERAPQVEALLRARGCQPVSRGRGERPAANGSRPVWLLDTMGELAQVYALADVAFVGGSLVPVGGHDLLQPLFHGKPVLCGPHLQNQRDVAALVLGEGAGLQVADAGALAAAVAECLARPERAAALRAAGERLLARHSGAARACAEALLERLARGGARP